MYRKNSLTCFISELRIQASCEPHQLSAPLQAYISITQPPISEIPSNEADIQLAISAIQTSQIPAVSPAAATYNVVESTLRNRRAGKPARRDCQPSSKKLTQLEEEVIVRYILDLDFREFAPTYAAVCDIADKLLTVRGVCRVSVY